MESLPLISVVVPVYNVEQWLERCVHSICNQSYHNLEIILVDDGSTDNSGNMCDELSKIDNRIKVIHKQNGGLSDARNAGLAETKGEYISFIDSDDWIEPMFLEKLYSAICEFNCDMAECDYIKTQGEVAIPKMQEKRQRVYDSTEALRLHLEDKLFKQVVWNKLYRRELVTISFEKNKYHEDIFWTYQVIAKCNRLVHIDEILYYYFQRDNSIMGEIYSVKRLDAVEASEQRCWFIENNYPELSCIAQGKFVEMCIYHSQWVLSSRISDKNIIIKNLCKRAYLIGVKWKKNPSILLKQKVWFGLYLYFPRFVCIIRNLLSIGK